MKHFLLLGIIWLFILFSATAQLDEHERHAQNRIQAEELEGYQVYLDSAKNSDSFETKNAYLEKALESADQDGAILGQIESYFQAGTLYHEAGSTRVALEKYEYVADLLEKHPNIVGYRQKVEMYHQMALNFSYLSQHSDALHYFLRSEKLARKHNLDSLLSDVLRQIGNVYHYLEDVDRSSEYYYESLEIAQEHGYRELEASAMNNIASNLADIGQIEDSEKMYQQSLEISQDIGYAELVAVVSNNLGVHFANQEQLDKALDYFNIALSYASKNNDLLARAIYNNNIADIHIREENFKKGRKALNSSLRDNERIGNKEGLASNYHNYVYYYMQQEDYDSAWIYIEKHEKLMEEMGSSSMKEIHLDLLQNYYASTGEYEKAYDHLYEFYLLNDSLNEARTGEQISGLYNVYEEQKEQKELAELKEQKTQLRHYLYLTFLLSGLFIIAVVYAFIVQRKAAKRVKKQNDRYIQNQKQLATKNRELVESQKKIEAINRDRNQLFSIISHDLRSPFNSLLGFSDMLAEEVREGADYESVKMMTENIHASSMQLFELIQNLLEWANKERGKIEFKPEQVILYRVAEESISLAANSAYHKEVTLHNNIDKHLMLEADVNMLNTIFRNLIFNAIKFTPKKGHVTIDAEEKADEIVVNVEDTGMGMSREDKEMILQGEDTFSRKGTQNEKGAGLGLVLTKDFIKRHNGKLDITTEVNKGTTFHVIFPKSR
ncbi:MAG: tetratricopeptide repeat protein [Bacteroidota bacterium]